MTITGQIINGTFVPDSPLKLSNGTRVRLETDHPLNFTEEESLSRIRQSLDEVSRGEIYDADEVMKELESEHSLTISR